MKTADMKHKDFLIALALALVVILLTGLVLDCSHDWGDDFAAYLLEGISLSKGTYPEQISMNYALHNRLDPRMNYGKTHIYVWGYPLLLSLVHHLAGYDTVAFSTLIYYKIPSLIFLGIFAFVFYLLLRKRFGIPISVLLVLLFCTYTRMTEYTNSTLTEVIFLSMCFVSFYISERYMEQESVKRKLLFAVLLGISLWYTYEVRLNGIMVLLCIVFQQVLNRFVFQKKPLCKRDLFLLIPYAVFGLLLLVFNVFLLGNSTSQSTDLLEGTLSTFLNNIQTYYLAVYEWLHDMVLHLHGGSRIYSRIIVSAMVWVNLLLFFVGIISDGFKKNNIYLSVFLITSFLGTCLLPFTQWIRYIFMLLPLFMMYVVYGLKRVFLFIKQRVEQKKGPHIVQGKLCTFMPAILCICLSLYAIYPLAHRAVVHGAQWQNHGLYAFSDDSREAYSYIQKNLPDDCVIQCNQYRALLLNTGRRTIHTNGDINVADYYMHIEDHADNPNFSTNDFSEIFHTDTIQLYERIK